MGTPISFSPIVIDYYYKEILPISFSPIAIDYYYKRDSTIKKHSSLKVFYSDKSASNLSWLAEILELRKGLSISVALKGRGGGAKTFGVFQISIQQLFFYYRISFIIIQTASRRETIAANSYLSIYLSIYIFIYLSIYLPLYISIYLSIIQTASRRETIAANSLFIYLSIYLSLYISIYLSIYNISII